jgi:hypothetical protein
MRFLGNGDYSDLSFQGEGNGYKALTGLNSVFNLLICTAEPDSRRLINCLCTQISSRARSW